MTPTSEPPEQESARRSARVDPSRAIVPGQAPTERVSAPESRDISARVTERSERRARRVTGEQVAQIARMLSDRDQAILQSVADYGLLRTTHLRQFHFLDHATPDAAARICRRTLKRLRDHRVIEPIERRIGGFRAGSDGIVWHLGPVGDRLLRDDEPDAPRARRREPSLRFLEHRMLVADVAGALTVQAHAGSFDLIRIDPEPKSWRTYSGLHGARDVLKPNLFAITASGEYEDHWFIEVDRGTESLPTLLKQCSQYETYRRSGREQAASGVFPRVLWLVPDEHRRERLRGGIGHDRALDAGLFRVHTFAELLPVITGGAS
jgi:hypothetical protein